MWGKSVFRMLYSSTLLFMYYNVFIRRRITRSANRETYTYIRIWHGIAFTYTVDIWKTQKRIYNILKLKIKFCLLGYKACSSVKLNQRLGDIYRLHFQSRRVRNIKQALQAEISTGLFVPRPPVSLSKATYNFVLKCHYTHIYIS
jgi:hypothetical protein